MKVRRDFVTNSSSSSFITVQIESKTLSEIIKRFQLEVCPKLYDEDVDLTEEDFNGYTYVLNNSNVDGDVVTYTEQDGYIYEAPKNLREALNTFISLFDTEYAIISRKGCVPKIDFEEENPLPKNSQIAKEILLRSKEIFNDIGDVEIEYNDYGWGGDSDTRMYPDCYDKRTLKKIYKNIAAEKGISVDEVTEEDFEDYAGCRSSNDTERFTYSKKTGKCKYRRTLELE